MEVKTTKQACRWFWLGWYSWVPRQHEDKATMSSAVVWDVNGNSRVGGSVGAKQEDVLRETLGCSGAQK